MIDNTLESAEINIEIAAILTVVALTRTHF